MCLFSNFGQPNFGHVLQQFGINFLVHRNANSFLIGLVALKPWGKRL
jgi:hypothetical protein